MQVRSLGWEDPLVQGLATRFSITAWRILWKERPGGLQSTGMRRVQHDWTGSMHTHARGYPSLFFLLVGWHQDLTFQPFLLQENVAEHSLSSSGCLLPGSWHNAVYNPVVLSLGFVCRSHVLRSPLSFLHLLCIQGPASCTLLPRCPCHLVADGSVETLVGDHRVEGR